ncbi:MAG: hypothetical protein ABI725_05440 [Chloroflexota bacterium]
MGVLLLVALGVGGAAWLLFGGPTAPGTPALTPTLATPTAHATRDPGEPLSIPSIQRGPHLVFQNVIRGDDYAKTSLVPLDSPGGMRLATGLICERVHFAAGHGICLAAEHGAESHYFAVLFDANFVPTTRVQLGGAPTFARVSPDGLMAAASFQTSPPEEEAPFAPSETWLLDTVSGKVVADLADFKLMRDGAELAESEVDYWGVTFKRDSDGFYASVRFGGNIYLVEGSIEGRRLVVLKGGLSAPALSPDESRVAYANLVSNIGPTWRFHVLDLTTMDDIELAETRSIDDQMEWMGGDTLLYGLATDIWSVQANGGGQALPFLFGGLSPTVVDPS